METLETFSDTEKVAQQFYCVCCDYTTSRRNNFNKHLLTRKHQKSSNGNIGNTKKVAHKKFDIASKECIKIENKLNLFSTYSSDKKSSKSSKKVAMETLETKVAQKIHHQKLITLMVIIIKTL